MSAPLLKILSAIPASEAFMETLPNLVTGEIGSTALSQSISLADLLDINCEQVVKQALTLTEDRIKPNQFLAMIEKVPAMRRHSTYI